MVAFSKIKRRGVLLPALCLAVLSLSSLSNAQYFADMNTGDKNAQNLDDEEDSSFVSKLNSHSTWYDVVSAHQRDMFNANGAFKQLSEQAGQVFELLTRDPKRDINNNKAHRERGGLRSGNDEQEAIRRAKQLAEKERIADMLENNILATDIPTSNKMYDAWLEKQGDRPGIRQDDKYDLIPHDTVYLHAEDVEETDSDFNLGRPGRVLKSVINGDEAMINRLDEPYPTECYNHGKLATQTQKYYMCKNLGKNANGKSNADQTAFRVTGETYNFLLTNYTD